MTEQSIPEYLSYATTNHASDIFIIAVRPLSFKIDGKLSTYGERMMPAGKCFLRIGSQFMIFVGGVPTGSVISSGLVEG